MSCGVTFVELLFSGIAHKFLLQEEESKVKGKAVKDWAGASADTLMHLSGMSIFRIFRLFQAKLTVGIKNYSSIKGEKTFYELYEQLKSLFRLTK